MLPHAIVLFCLLLLTVSQTTGHRRGYYTVVAPGTVRTNTPYQVSVSLGDFHQASVFNISLSDRSQLNLQKTVEVQPGTTQLVNIDVPKLRFSVVKLRVLGFKGIATKHEANISVENYDYQVYIQSDKPRYKPGELVQFRVICVDDLTRPAITDDILGVSIYDSYGNLVKRLENIKLTQGVFKGQLRLSEHTLLGRWNIQVDSSGSSMKTKSFLVSKYVLPRFTMEIVTKRDVSVQEGKIKILVKATYAHDEPVKGNLSVTVSSILGQTFSRKVNIDGYHMISLDLERDLHVKKKDFKSKRLYRLHVDAWFKDAESKQVVEEKVDITIHHSPYKIKIDAPKEFIPEVPLDVKVSITDLQNKPVTDQRSPVIIFVKSPELNVVDVPVITFLNGKGVGVAQLNLANQGFSKYSISAEFNEYESRHEEIEMREKDVFILNVLTPRPNIGEEMAIELISESPIGHFVYEIVSRGKILKAERVNVPGDSMTHLLRITTTHNMIPKASLYVHRIKNHKLSSALTDIYIGEALRNSIEIHVDREVRPGALVSVNVSAVEGSYVGLLGIDRRLLLEAEQENDFTSDRTLNRLREFDAWNLNTDVNTGSRAGLVTFTNVVKSHKDSGGGFILGSRFDFDDANKTWAHDTPKPQTRTIFSDGWLFEDIERIPKGGLQLHSVIPDAITSWAITGFSLNPITGLGFTKTAATLRTFQSFFVSMDLPNLVRAGEILEIPVYVFNYNNVNVLTAVTIESLSEHLVILETFTEDAPFSFNHAFSAQIPPQGKIKFSFAVKALEAGLFNLTVKATSPVGNDALLKTLSVVSQGIAHVSSQTYLVNFLEQSEQEDELLVSIPEFAIQGSEKVELSVVGDTFGPLTQSLLDLVQVPYGNGREMTTHFLSNILVLKYLKAFDVKNHIIERKALVFLELGYQNILTLKHLDGSFSFFGKSTRRSGDALHTAIVMWGLQQAKNFIQVDRDVITRCLNFFLKPMQAPDGGFQSEEGSEDDVTVTALALLSFMEDESHADVVSKGLDFLFNKLDDLESPINTALSKYVLVLGRHEKSRKILKELSSDLVSGQTSRQLVWDRLTTLQGTLKVTSGSFYSVLQSQAKPTDTLLPLVPAMLSLDDSEKIPTHLLALDVMIEFARNLRVENRNLTVHFESDQGDLGDVKVNSSNARVLHTVQLNSAARKVRLQSRGKGFAVVSIKSQYNVLGENQTSSAYQTNVTVSERRGSFVSLKVCVSAQTAADFIALEVGLPSGYTYLEENYFNFGAYASALKVDSKTGYIQTILEGIDQTGTCVRVDAVRAFRVLNAREVSVTVSSVYDEDAKFTTFHKVDLGLEAS